MSTDPDPVQHQADGEGKFSVDARQATGVQVGEGNTQIIYSYRTPPRAGAIAPPPSVGISGDVDSPYRGLKFFREEDAAFFFGREAEATEILERLSVRLEEPGLLVVSGVSGAGKSSLLRAGVLPRIRGAGPGSAPGSTPWLCLVITPTREPLNELASGVASLAGADAASIRRELDNDPSRFALTVRQAATTRADEPGDELDRQERRLLLVVDQFEQVFTQCTDEDQRRAFIAALHSAATTGHGPNQVPAGLIVLVVRADFEARCAEYSQLAAAVQDRYLVTSMTPLRLRMAITEPAKMAGSYVDSTLVETLLRDVQARVPMSSPAGSWHGMTSGAGVLPLLSHALDQAWRNRSGDIVGLADYVRIGGIDGGVAASADRAYGTLTPGQQSAARQIFMRLITTNSDGVDSAARVARTELTEGKSYAQIRDVDAVLEAFAAERLLTLGVDWVEISHEALLTAWKQLRDWLDGDQLDRVMYSQLTADARTWDINRRNPSYLYRPGRLTEISAAANRWKSTPTRYPPLNLTSAAFLNAARRATRRSRQRLQAIFAILLAFALVASAAAVLAVHYAANAKNYAANERRQQAIILSRQLAAESLSLDPADPITARQLAVAAWRVNPTNQAGAAMATLLTEQQQNGDLPADSSATDTYGVAFSPDGKLLATAADDGYVRLWNPVTGSPVGKPLPADIGSTGGGCPVAFSPDGELLATAGDDGYVRLWNPVTGSPVGKPLPADHDGPNDPNGGVSGVAFSPDGKLLASADANGFVRLWNPVTGSPVGKPLPADSGSGDGVNEVLFSPDGKLLATADANGYVRLWNPVTDSPVGKPLPADAGLGGEVTTAPFSPDGKPVPAPTQSNAVLSYVTAVAFSPDGKLLATAADGGYVRLWNPVTGSPVGKPLPADAGQNGESGGVFGVAFSPDGKLLASGDGDGFVRLWNPVTGSPVGKPLPADPNGPNDPNGGASGVAFSPDGKLLASAADGGYVRLWNPVTGSPFGKPLVPATSPDGGVLGVAFSPDGKRLASAAEDGYVRLWNPVTGSPVGKPLPADPGPIGGAYGIAFSPDGKRLASAGDNGFVRLWNPVTGSPIGKPLPADPGDSNGGVIKVAFSPDGKLLASADANGFVRLWNPVTGSPVGKPLPADPNGQNDSNGGVFGVAFSPDGKLLASADANGFVRLWNPVTGSPVGKPLPADPNGQNDSNGGVFGVAFSPDGKLLASADANGYVRLWNPVTGSPVGKPLPADAGASSGVSAVAFSPDGKPLPAATGPNGVPGLATAVVFSPDGKLLASADANGYVRLWNPVTGSPVGEPLPADPSTNADSSAGVYGVAFSPDGKVLASANLNGAIDQWQVQLFTDPYSALCADVGPPTKTDWNDYAPGEPQPNTCAGQSLAPLP